jgi:hypothetical protein
VFNRRELAADQTRRLALRIGEKSAVDNPDCFLGIVRVFVSAQVHRSLHARGGLVDIQGVFAPGGKKGADRFIIEADECADHGALLQGIFREDRFDENRARTFGRKCRDRRCDQKCKQRAEA